MAKGQLPKAYLRIDPNLDQHPDADGMLRLICAANRLPRRGRWDSREQIDRILGRKRASTFLKPRRKGRRPDVTELPDGTFYLEGWDEWQEGDHTVGERVARLRARRNMPVTEPLHPPFEEPAGTVTGSLPGPLQKPLPPSEALRRQGVKANTPSPYPAPDGAGDFVLAPGLEHPAANNGHGDRISRRAVEGILEQACLHAIALGYHPNRDDRRHLREEVKAGFTLGQITAWIDEAKARGQPVLYPNPKRVGRGG